VLVAHAFNPSYSGGRDQKDYGLKPVWANSSQDPASKKHITTIGLVEWLKVSTLSSNPSTAKKRKSNIDGVNLSKYIICMLLTPQ
jgi:hypothetical protein